MFIDLRIGNDKKALENLFEANMENVAVSNENHRVERNAKIRDDLYFESTQESKEFKNRPRDIAFGK